jgi:hypothetical protein
VDEEKAVNELAAPFLWRRTQGSAQRISREKNRRGAHCQLTDQLELIIMLKEYEDLGNKYTKDWIGFIFKRLCTAPGKRISANNSCHG